MSPLHIAILVFVALIVGTAAGALLSKTIHYDVLKIKNGTQASFNAVATDLHHLLDRIEKLESAAKEEVSRLVH